MECPKFNKNWINDIKIYINNKYLLISISKMYWYPGFQTSFKRARDKILFDIDNVTLDDIIIIFTTKVEEYKINTKIPVKYIRRIKLIKKYCKKNNIKPENVYVFSESKPMKISIDTSIDTNFDDMNLVSYKDNIIDINYNKI